MNTEERLEQDRKTLEKMKYYSTMVNEALGQPENRVGIKYCSNVVCPRCLSNLKRKAGIVKGEQRWQCLVCWKVYFEESI
jgi:transposase-like protein